MEDLNLKEGRTYLLRYGSTDTLQSVTVLLATEKAYHLRWNRGEHSSDNWEMKTRINIDYSVVEDITETMIKIKLDDFINNKNLEVKQKWVQCFVCKGFGTVPNSNVTGGQTSCPRCHGSKMIQESIETQF